MTADKILNRNALVEALNHLDQASNHLRHAAEKSKSPEWLALLLELSILRTKVDHASRYG
jgi:hypothetical protein